VEVPGQEIVEAIVGVAAGNRLEGCLEIGEGFDAVDLRRLDQRGDAAPGSSALVMAGEECVFSVNRPLKNPTLDALSGT